MQFLHLLTLVTLAAGAALEPRQPHQPAIERRAVGNAALGVSDKSFIYTRTWSQDTNTSGHRALPSDK